MKAKEIAKLSKEDAEKKMNELKKELIKLNAQAAAGTPPKSPGQIKKIKKIIARIMTVQGDRKNNE
jgi:large subunit ribosomal protein L29